MSKSQGTIEHRMLENFNLIAWMALDFRFVERSTRRMFDLLRRHLSHSDYLTV